MTYEEAQKASEALGMIENRVNLGLSDWIALVKDTLRNNLPANSQLLTRLEEIGSQNTRLGKAILSAGAPEQAAADESEMTQEQQYQGVVRAARVFIKSLAPEYAPLQGPPKDLDNEVELAITRRYFKSWPFQLVVVLVALLLTLITGVGGLQMYTQVQAMKNLVANAEKTLREADAQVAQAKSDIAQRRAEMALIVLTGDAELQKARTEAGQSLELARTRYLEELKNKTNALSSDLDSDTKKRAEQLNKRTDDFLTEFNRMESQEKTKVADKVETVIQSLEASKSRLVPAIAFSIAKRWLILPLALFISVLAWVTAVVKLWRQAPRAKVAAAVSVLLFLVAFSAAIYMAL